MSDVAATAPTQHRLTLARLAPGNGLMWLWIVVLMIPMVVNWVKLRRKPRPARVSGRRIQMAGWYSLVLGVSWAALAVAALEYVPEILQASLLLSTVIMCAGAVASVSALPFAALAYFAPVITMTLIVSSIYGKLAYTADRRHDRHDAGRASGLPAAELENVPTQR